MTDITTRLSELAEQLKQDREGAARLKQAVASKDTHAAQIEAQIEDIQKNAWAAQDDPQIAADTLHLQGQKAIRKTMADERIGLPARPRNKLDLGRQLNLELSIATIDQGLHVAADSGWVFETLRVGQLYREAGLTWRGTLPEVERRLRELIARRDDARARLAVALLSDDERAARMAADRERARLANAGPQRKVRHDGSRYDVNPDGREVEVTHGGAAAVSQAEQAGDLP